MQSKECFRGGLVLGFLLGRLKQDAFAVMDTQEPEEAERSISAVSSSIGLIKENAILAAECGVGFPRGAIEEMEHALEGLQDADFLQRFDMGLRLTKAARDATFSLGT